jgi:hypothetical protein
MLVHVKWFLRLVVSLPVQELGLGYARVAEAFASKGMLSTLQMEVERRGGVPEFDVMPTVMGISISSTVQMGVSVPKSAAVDFVPRIIIISVCGATIHPLLMLRNISYLLPDELER